MYDLHDLLDRLDAAAAGKGPDSIRDIVMRLETVADNEERRLALLEIKRPGRANPDYEFLALNVRTAFLRGAIGEDGWLRK